MCDVHRKNIVYFGYNILGRNVQYLTEFYQDSFNNYLH